LNAVYMVKTWKNLYFSLVDYQEVDQH
jgi:hypothetical protein